jgi:hypothetical protein
VRALIWPPLLMSLLVVRCASTPVRTNGVTGAVAWHATDFQLTQATVQGQPGERYAFTRIWCTNSPVGLDTWWIDRHVLDMINPNRQRGAPCQSPTNVLTDIPNIKRLIA